MVELVEKRTINSKTFDLGNGRRALDISIGAVHYKDEQGKWQDIDEGYSEADTAPFKRKYRKLLYHLRFADDSSRRIYPDRNDLSYWVEFGKPIPDTGLPEKVKKEVWRWKLGTYDFDIGITGSVVKFNILLKNEGAPTSFSIPFVLNGLTRDGFLLKRDGQIVAEIRKPFAVDAEGTRQAVSISFGEGNITLSLDTTGLIYPIEIDPTLDLQVGASSDDCRRRLVPSGWSLTYARVLAGAGAEGYYQEGSGMRFINITIPQGATIDVAYLTLRAHFTDSGTVVNTRISAEDVDDAPTFADDAAAFDTRWAARTTARVDWDSIPAWTAETDYNSPEIKTVIKEVVDRAGWASGQDMVIFWEDYDDRSTHAATARRLGYSYDSSSTYAPKLHIEYTPPITEKTSSDTGSGVEALTQTVALVKSDSGSGVEALGSRIFGAAESGLGVETSLILASLLSVETGSGLDALIELAKLTELFSSDAGSGIDALTALNIALTQSDTGTGLDTALLLAALLSSDHALSTEVAAILLKALRAADHGMGIDRLRAKIETPTKGGDMRLLPSGQASIPSREVNI